MRHRELRQPHRHVPAQLRRGHDGASRRHAFGPVCRRAWQLRRRDVPHFAHPRSVAVRLRDSSERGAAAARAYQRAALPLFECGRYSESSKHADRPHRGHPQRDLASEPRLIQQEKFPALVTLDVRQHRLEACVSWIGSLSPRCGYWARQTGLRFSRNARTPSLASSLWRTSRATFSMSSCHASKVSLMHRRTVAFIARRDRGALPATFSASAVATSPSLASGTTSWTMFISRLRDASIKSAV